MKNAKGYIKSMRFALGHAFRFVPKETIVILFIGVIFGSLPYASSFVLGKLVNTLVSGINNNSNSIWYLLVIYALIGALPMIIGNIQSYFGRRRMLKLQMELDMELLKKRESIDIATHEDSKFQDLIQRTFRNGLSPIFQLIGSQLDIVRALSSLVLGTILAVHFNSIVYLVVILSAIPSFYMDIKYAGKSWSIWAKDSPEQRKLADIRQHLTYKVPLIETKLLQSGRKLLDTVRNIFNEFTEKQLGLEKNRALHTTISDSIAFLGFAAGLMLIVRSVINGEAQVGTLVYMMGTLSAVRGSVGNLLDSISGQYENSLIVQDMMEFFATKPVIVEVKNPKKIKLDIAPEIIFENVSFKYPNTDKWSLRNLTVTFQSGHNIGLVGNNGAGKTTLVKLLCRIHDPTEGRVLINGVDLKEIAIKEWWSYLAVMFQDYASYDFLVKEAIAIGRPDKNLNLTKVIDSAHTSQAHTFIEEWENKYDEQLGVEFKGKEPSKGQRQKLAIAKTLYRDGFVMILDEPTASVDAESEAKIFDSIENLPKDRTAILISHDFSTISQCDKIFVMEEGALIEEGNHKELMKKKGKYSELYDLQAKRFKK